MIMTGGCAIAVLVEQGTGFSGQFWGAGLFPCQF